MDVFKTDLLFDLKRVNVFNQYTTPVLGQCRNFKSNHRIWQSGIENMR